MALIHSRFCDFTHTLNINIVHACEQVLRKHPRHKEIWEIAICPQCFYSPLMYFPTHCNKLALKKKNYLQLMIINFR